MMEPAVLTVDEVADRFRMSTTWFRGARKGLEAAGFPAPLPGTSGRRWSRAAVDRWLAGEVRPAHPDAGAVLAERGKSVAAGIGGRRARV